MGGKGVNNQRGLTLLVVLVMIVVLGLSAGLAGQTISSLMQQEREAELLWRGDQYRKAIGSYFAASAQGAVALKAYPQRLEDLLRDPRSLATKRHLRRLYPDPMTGEPFQIIKDPGGRLVGVRSASEGVPFKKDGFPVEYEEFRDAEKYSAWEFRYAPPKVQPGATTPQPGTTAPAPGTTIPSPGTTTPSPGVTTQGTITPPPPQGFPEGWTPWTMPEK